MPVTERYPDERFIGVEIHPDLLRDEADRLDATPATGLASWALGEAAALLRLAADTWARAALAAQPQPLFEGTEADLEEWLGEKSTVDLVTSHVVVYPAVAGSAIPTESDCTCVPGEGCDAEGDPGCRYCQVADSELPCPADDDAVAGLATPTQCICPRFRDTGGVRIADLACPVHGVEGTDPGDGYWGDEAAAGSATSTLPPIPTDMTWMDGSPIIDDDGAAAGSATPTGKEDG